MKKIRNEERKVLIERINYIIELDNFFTDIANSENNILFDFTKKDIMDNHCLSLAEMVYHLFAYLLEYSDDNFYYYNEEIDKTYLILRLYKQVQCFTELDLDLFIENPIEKIANAIKNNNNKKYNYIDSRCIEHHSPTVEFCEQWVARIMDLLEKNEL